MKNIRKYGWLFGIGSLILLNLTGCTETVTSSSQEAIPNPAEQKTVTGMQEPETTLQEPEAGLHNGAYYDGSNLQGHVTQLTADGFMMAPAFISQEAEGEVMAEAAPEADNKEQEVEIIYADPVSIQIATIDSASLTEISREDAEKEVIKKQTDVCIFGSCQDTRHWIADKILIIRWR
ncbi:MAG: hypothetical protein IJ106_06815 [Parasporobacterium sp.]|nr:hypothetical protein [Parasporobacterium sp.]